MKKLLSFLPWTLALLGCVAGVVFYNRLQNERLRLLEARHKAEIAAATLRLEELDKILAETRADLAREREDAARDRAALLKRLDAVRTATPTELVTEGRRILRTEEIDLLQDGRIVFSLSAYRTNVESLVDWEDAVVNREPNLRAQIGSLTTLVTTYEEKDRVWASRCLALEGTNAALRQALRKQKWSGYLKQGLAAGVGYGVGKALEAIFGR